MTFKLTCRLSNYESTPYQILLSGVFKLQTQTKQVRDNNTTAFAASHSVSWITFLDTFLLFFFSFSRQKILMALHSQWLPSKELDCLILGEDLSLHCSVQQSWSTQIYHRPLDWEPGESLWCAAIHQQLYTCTDNHIKKFFVKKKYPTALLIQMKWSMVNSTRRLTHEYKCKAPVSTWLETGGMCPLSPSRTRDRM